MGVDESEATCSLLGDCPAVRCSAGDLTPEVPFRVSVSLATFVVRADPTHFIVRRKVVPALTRTSATAARPIRAGPCQRFSRRRGNACTGAATGTGAVEGSSGPLHGARGVL